MATKNGSTRKSPARVNPDPDQAFLILDGVRATLETLGELNFSRDPEQGGTFLFLAASIQRAVEYIA